MATTAAALRLGEACAAEAGRSGTGFYDKQVLGAGAHPTNDIFAAQLALDSG